MRENVRTSRRTGGLRLPSGRAAGIAPSQKRDGVPVVIASRTCSSRLSEWLPELPAGEHPDDLLNDEEAAALLGVRASTVRAYATQGYLSPGKTLYSLRVWPRRDVEERLNNPPGQGKGGGRPPGTGKGPRKAHAYEGDPRLHTAAAALSKAGDTPRHHLAASLAQQHGGSTRTWERLLTQAGQTSPPG